MAWGWGVGVEVLKLLQILRADSVSATTALRNR